MTKIYIGDEYTPVILTRSNTLKFLIRTKPQCGSTPPQFRIYYQAIRKGLTDALHVVHTSPVSGYVQPVGLVPGKPYGFALGTDARYHLVLPEGQVVMTSIRLMQLTRTIHCRAYLVVYSRSTDGQETLLWKTCHKTGIATRVYQTSLLIRFKVKSYTSNQGFKLLYTFHLQSQSPHKLPTSMFNCSVSHYPDFKEHLDCNLKQECEEREDEGGHCSFSSQRCNGSVTANSKCIDFYGKILSKLVVIRETERKV